MSSNNGNSNPSNRPQLPPLNMDRIKSMYEDMYRELMRTVQRLIMQNDNPDTANAVTLEERHRAVYMAMWEVLLMLEGGMKKGTPVEGSKKPLSIEDFRVYGRQRFEDTEKTMRKRGLVQD